MAEPTDRLGLGKPDDGSGNWGQPYRDAMDTIDAHPGIRVVWTLSEVTDPWVGQHVYEASTGKTWKWSGVDWGPLAGEAPAPAPSFYRHVQGVPAAVWTITHNLGYFPGGVTVKDSAGDLHEGRITYIDMNTISISFFAGGNPAAFSGEAYLS
jgi:hypothetical protein